jgi:hypothetical protein
MKDIDIKPKGIGELIYAGRLRVPVHQRNYYWDGEKVTKLFDDFKPEVDHGEPYFLGTIVLTRTPDDYLGVIDGQQRIATTMIILASIRDIFHARGDEAMVQSVQQDFLFRRNRDTEEEEGKLRLNLKDQNFFLINILKNPKDERRISAKPASSPSNLKLETAAKIIRAKFTDALKAQPEPVQKDYLKRWLDFIEKKAFAIVAIAGSDDDAYAMFETLNDRGMRVSQADMLKSFVIGKSGERETEVVAKWESVTTNIESLGSEDEVVDYFRILSSVLHGLTREREVFHRLKLTVDSQGSAAQFVYQLEDFANDYVAMLSPDHQKWNDYPASIRRSLKTLKLLDVQQIRYLMLAVAHHFNKSEAAKAFNLFVNWTVRFFIAAPDKIGRVEAKYAELAHAIHTSNTITTASDLAKEMAPRLATNEEFVYAFATARVSQGKLARYYLDALERSKSGNDRPELVPDDDTSKVNLEHIIPLNPEPHWPDIDLETAKSLYNRIGNMVLLDAKKNAKIGNLGFDEKKKAFAESALFLTRRIAKFSKWGPDQVTERQLELSELAVKTWPLTLK